MKNILLILVASAGTTGFAAVTITPAMEATNIPADYALNAASPDFIQIGDINITEGSFNDIAAGTGRTLILTLPAGWRFNTNFGAVSFQRNRDITSASLLVTTSNVVVTLDIGGTSSRDNAVIKNLQVQCINGAVVPVAGQILRTVANPGTAVIAGVTNGVTSFGELSQVVGAVHSLQIITQPSPTATAGVPFTVQPVIQLRDQFGNLRSAANGLSDSATEVVASRRVGLGELQGTVTVTAKDGVVTFFDLAHHVANTIDLEFSVPEIAEAVSTSIHVNPGPAHTLIFTREPGSAMVGAPFGVQPIVRTVDAFGNFSTVGLLANHPVTVALSSGAGTLLGTTSANIGSSGGNGEVEFVDLRMDVSGPHKKLAASAGGLLSAPSEVFAVEPYPQTISFGALNDAVYGQPAVQLQATASSGLPVQFEIVSGPASVSGDFLTIAGAGSITVRAMQPGNTFYAPAPHVERSFSVAKALLTVTVDDATRPYGAENPEFTGTISGIQNGDNISASYSSSAIPGSNLGTYPIEPSFIDPDNKLQNYDINITNGVLTIVHGVEFITEPVSQIVDQGTNVIFSASATGYELSFQWRRKGENIPGATTSILSIPHVQLLDQGIYSVVVSNPAITLTSAEAHLQVVPDLMEPRVALRSHLTNAIVHNSDPADCSVLIRGVASDNVYVRDVLWSVNGGDFQSALIDCVAQAVDWSATVPLEPGTNRLVIKSVDFADNESQPVSASFFYTTTSPFIFNIHGEGAVVPANSPFGRPDSGKTLIVGRPYKLTAIPGPDHVFTNWTRVLDGVTNVYSDNSVLTFIMEPNLVLNANFIPNPFIPASGNYNGLFYEADGVKHHSSGFVTLKVTPRMTFSAKLLLDGNTLPISGKFNIAGESSITILRPKAQKSALQLDLAMDFANQQLHGRLHGAEWSADLLADRAVWSKDNPATAFTSKSTLVIPGFDDPADGPFGFGFGSACVDSLGFARLNGRVPDGSVIKQGVAISKSGDWPFFASINPVVRHVTTSQTSYRIVEYRGSLLGWLAINNQAPRGALSWIKTAHDSPLYANGFTNVASVISSPYIAPRSKQPAIEITAGALQLDGGNLSDPITLDASVSPANAIQITPKGAFDLKLSIQSTTGLLAGQFMNPANPSIKTKLFGVVLQEQKLAAGFFLGPTESGALMFEE